VTRTIFEPFMTYAKKIEAATKFGNLLEPGDDRDRMFKRYSKIVHPDVAPEPLKERAEVVFARLNQLYSEETKPPIVHPVVIAGYVVMGPLSKGDIADLYEAQHAAGGRFVLKISRSPKDNDLMDREAAALKVLRPPKPSVNDIDFFKYIPELHASTKASGRRVNVISEAVDCISLKEIVACQDGIGDFRHIVWMGNRALSALGYLHRQGVIHGAVLPPHLMYRPADHGFQLVDYCYSCQVENNEKVPAMAKEYQDWYAPEIIKKRPASAATDIFMLMTTLKKVANNMPTRFRDLITWCTAGSPASRPGDAWFVQDKWATLAKEEYGKPKFVPFTLK